MSQLFNKLVPLDKLRKDIKQAAVTMTQREARYLVDIYYQMQSNRIRAAGQIRAIDKSGGDKPHATLDWVLTQSELLETSIRSVLGEFAQAHVVGKWSQSICGIGAVISAGLIANIGMRFWKCAIADGKNKPCTATEPHGPACHEETVNTASRVWRYAGLDPTLTWQKGQKRPWNASLKTLCWKIGQSFVKVSNNDSDFYGKLYKQRKSLEIERNEAGQFAEQASRILTEKKIGKETDAYKAYSQGKLPPAHIQQRAERYAVKLFLSHWHQVAFFAEFNALPPKPYALSILGHADEIQVPNWPCNDSTK